MITTANNRGRINAASFGTCVRGMPDPVIIAFTVGAPKDTCNSISANGEFVVNVHTRFRRATFIQESFAVS